MFISCFKDCVKRHKQFLAWIQFYDLQFTKEHEFKRDAISFPRSCRGQISFPAIAVIAVLSVAEKECKLNSLELLSSSHLLIMEVTEDLQHVYRQDCWVRTVVMPSSTCGQAHMLASFSVALWQSPDFLIYFFFLHHYIKTKSHKHLDLVMFIFWYVLSKVSSHTWSLFLLLDQLFSELENIK